MSKTKDKEIMKYIIEMKAKGICISCGYKRVREKQNCLKNENRIRKR